MTHSCHLLSEDEKRSLVRQRERDKFTRRYRACYGDKIHLPRKRFKLIGLEKKEKDDGFNDEMNLDPLLEDFPPFELPAPSVEPSNVPEADLVDGDGKPTDNLDHFYDTFINMEVYLPKGEREIYGQVVGLYLNCNGNMIGTPHTNPICNTFMYEKILKMVHLRRILQIR